MGLHYSGPLLTWIEEYHPEYFERLNALVGKGQVELLGGGFYEPILISIPPADQRAQITRLAEYLRHHFGEHPTGAWLAERVWEPQLPSVLASAGVDYTIVDDIHFQSAGFEPEELFADYVAEDQGKIIRLIPGLKTLRYLIPFSSVDHAIGYLKESAEAHPEGMAATGDDMEKFGVWPGTHELCYEPGEGWLGRFFAALEENSSWLQVCSPREYFAEHPAKGRADLPTASYAEMMEWSLPTPVRERYDALLGEFHSRPEVLRFLRGGTWRGFFRKYSESNLLHKKMLYVSQRIASTDKRRKRAKAIRELAHASDLVHRAQCNDAYWHGVFGGLYAPHLRTEHWRNLIRAEAILDEHVAGGDDARAETLDYDGDGAEEVLLTSREAQALIKPSDGGTIAALDFRPTGSAIINSMQRRPESYHARLRETSQQQPAPGGAVSIHEQTRVKEPNLERFLHYDRWPRNAFRMLVFDPSRGHSDYETLRLEEDAGFAGGAFAMIQSGTDGVACRREGVLANQLHEAKVSVTKKYSLHPIAKGCEVRCALEMTLANRPSNPVAIGLESVVNLLAPNEPDRFIETPAGPHNLRFSGVLPAPDLFLEDGWQRLRICICAPGAQHFWVAPIETVSESEDGFERVYQGSQILAVWRPEFSNALSWTAQLVLRVESL